MKNKKRRIICIFLLVFALIIGLLIYIYVMNKDKDDNEIEDVKVINKIDKYNYTLNDNETSYYKDKFNELLELSKKEEINDEELISLVTSLFLSDYYNLDNKKDNLDIGGLQFIFEDEKDDFLTVSKNTLYKYLKNNYNGKRDQILPIVTDVVINKIDKIKYTYLGKTEDCYQVSSSIKYQEDLGFQSDVTLILVKDNDTFSIVELK